MAATATKPEAPAYQGTEKLLWGIVLGVITFWLFAGTTGTIAPVIQKSTGVDVTILNLAVSITALFSGIFIVAMGGLADRTGRVRIALFGNILGLTGSLLIVFAGFLGGVAGAWIILLGRAVQGVSAACIMPSTMALVKAYWDGKGRQRGVSMWSIGSWGGSGFAALFGGLFSAGIITGVDWKWIFIVSAGISVISFLMIMGTPESKIVTDKAFKFDLNGFLIFFVSMLSLMVVLIFGAKIGWTSPITLVLAAVAIVGLYLFVRVEQKAPFPFIDFKLFANSTFTGATISNFLLNGTIGILIISQQMIQLAGCAVRDAADPTKCVKNYSSWDAGLLTLSYGIVIVAFIRVGEKLLQKFGPRKPMIWGSLIVIVSCFMLMQTQLMIEQYSVLAIIAYALFGLGLAFYATPSTDAALANLPAAQAGAGSGIYKMASSLGGAIGAAISLAVFTALRGDVQIATQIGDVIEFQGIQSNIPIRLAGIVALLINMIFLVMAIASIMITVPKGNPREK